MCDSFTQQKWRMFQKSRLSLNKWFSFIFGNFSMLIGEKIMKFIYNEYLPKGFLFQLDFMNMLQCVVCSLSKDEEYFKISVFLEMNEINNLNSFLDNFHC